MDHTDQESGKQIVLLAKYNVMLGQLRDHPTIANSKWLLVGSY